MLPFVSPLHGDKSHTCRYNHDALFCNWWFRTPLQSLACAITTITTAVAITAMVSLGGEESTIRRTRAIICTEGGTDGSMADM